MRPSYPHTIPKTPFPFVLHFPAFVRSVIQHPACIFTSAGKYRSGGFWPANFLPLVQILIWGAQHASPSWDCFKRLQAFFFHYSPPGDIRQSQFAVVIQWGALPFCTCCAGIQVTCLHVSLYASSHVWFYSIRTPTHHTEFGGWLPPGFCISHRFQQRGKVSCSI